MKLTLGKKLGLGFGIILALMVTSAGLGYFKLRTIESLQGRLFATRIPTSMAAIELQRDLKNLRTDFNQMAQQILTAPDQPASPSGANPPTKDSKPISTAPASDNDITDPGAPPTS